MDDPRLIEFNVWQALGVSVVASLIAVLVIGTIRFLYIKGIREYVQSLIQRTQIDISGTWEGESKEAYKNGDEIDEHLFLERVELKQKGRDVTGESLYTANHEGGETTKAFELVGFIKNDVFVGTYENKHRGSTGVGSFLLFVKEDGCMLEGKAHIYNVISRDLWTTSYKLRRKS